jgi:hypothetical protein
VEHERPVGAAARFARAWMKWTASHLGALGEPLVVEGVPYKETEVTIERGVPGAPG